MLGSWLLHLILFAWTCSKAELNKVIPKPKSLPKNKKLKVNVNFKMALRKQPDRRVKKKRKIEMPENLDITQRKHDIVGDLLCNYGMTGENLVRDIFSYMDVSSIQGM